MSVEQLELRTQRGDTIVATLFEFAGEVPTVCVTLDDADETPAPTVELTMAELGQLREILRRLGEKATRDRWTTRR